MVLSLRRLDAQHRRGAAPVASPDRPGRREPGHEKGVQVVKISDLKPGARFSVLATGLRGVLVASVQGPPWSSSSIGPTIP